MYPLLETLRFENGKFSNTAYHLERMKRSVKDCLQSSLKFNPEDIFEKTEEENLNLKGLFKFRLLYNTSEFKTEFVKYTLPTVKTLKPVFADKIDYSCKFADRRALNLLAAGKENCDDILIIHNGFVTDTSFANVLFYDGTNWLTPDTPLLAGTMRAYLLDQGIIKPAHITLDTAKNFKKVRIINAMIRFDDKVDVTIC